MFGFKLYRSKPRPISAFEYFGYAMKHHDTIDQILSYLTFRDSKTAIVYFVDTKEMMAPLKGQRVSHVLILFDVCDTTIPTF
jgi:hypothetical protein